MPIIENAIQWMEKTARNDSHGYDQKYRWGEYGDYDCSSAVITAWSQAGVAVRTAGATYTGNMYQAFIKAGFVNVTKSINFKTGAGLQRGDVLLNVHHHVAMYCGNKREVEASINEKGRTTGGIPGDQTGKEFFIRAYRNYPWDCVLRYIEKTSEQIAKEVLAGKWSNGTVRKLMIEGSGYNYNEVQTIVNNMLMYGGSKTPNEVAGEIISGKWGNGAERRRRLKEAGYKQEVIAQIQEIVNQLLRK